MDEPAVPDIPQALTYPTPKEAYEALRSEFESVSKSARKTVNFDIPWAVTLMVGAFPKMRALRSSIVVHLVTFDLERYDKIELYTMALMHTQAMHMAARKPVSLAPALAQEGAVVRDLLLSDARALIRRGLLSKSRLIGLKSTTSHRSIAFDVLLLAMIFRDEWSNISNKTAMTMTELENVERLGGRIVEAVGQREQAAVEAGETAEIRRSAFSLFFDAYVDARRAARYLAPNAPDAWVPNLYPGRSLTGRKPAKKDERVEADERSVRAEAAEPVEAPSADPFG
jgi:hypothetical protein